MVEIGWIVLGMIIFIIILTIILSGRDKRRDKKRKGYAFVIEVEKKQPNKDFSFEEVMKEAQVFHKACYIGKAEWEEKNRHWVFTCKRCKTKVKVDNSEEIRRKIVCTTIDGKERLLYKDDYTYAKDVIVKRRE